MATAVIYPADAPGLPVHGGWPNSARTTGIRTLLIIRAPSRNTLVRLRQTTGLGIQTKSESRFVFHKAGRLFSAESPRIGAKPGP